MKKYITTLSKLFDIRQLIANNGILDLAFSRKAGLSVARNIKKIDNELAEYDKSRDELIRKYSDNGVTMNRSNPNWNEFIKEYNEIGSVEASLEINMITDDDLPENITPSACMAIDFMIEDPVKIVE